MKLWIVMQDYHEDTWPIAVFSSKEKADEYIQSVNRKTGHETIWIPDDDGFEMDTPKFPSLL